MLMSLRLFVKSGGIGVEGKKSMQSQTPVKHWGLGWAWMSFGNKFLICFSWPDWLLWKFCPKSHPHPRSFRIDFTVVYLWSGVTREEEICSLFCFTSWCCGSGQPKGAFYCDLSLCILSIWAWVEKRQKPRLNMLLSHATTALVSLLPLCDFLVSFNLWEPAVKGFRPNAESSSVSNHAHTPISPWKPCAPFAWGKQNLCWVVDAAQALSSAKQVERREPGDHQTAEKYYLIGFSAFDVTQSSSSNALL